MAAPAARPPTAIAPAKRLASWMNDVLHLRQRVLHALDAEPVHDIRVALRRCRTVARGMQATDDRGRWRNLDRRSAQLLRAFGALRDSQVHRAIVEKTARRRSLFRDYIKRSLEKRAATASRDAVDALREFDVPEWKRLGKAASADPSIRSMTRVRARHIVLRRWLDTADAHELALRANDPTTWHNARIAWKNLRYSLEAFAPDLHKEWDTEVGELQTALGDAHDLDSFSEFLREHARKRDHRELRRWLATIHVQREPLIGHYKRLTRGQRGAWRGWGQRLLMDR